MSFVNIDRSTTDPLNVFNYPDLMLDRDIVVDLDARQARPGAVDRTPPVVLKRGFEHRGLRTIAATQAGPGTYYLAARP